MVYFLENDKKDDEEDEEVDHDKDVDDDAESGKPFILFDSPRTSKVGAI